MCRTIQGRKIPTRFFISKKCGTNNFINNDLNLWKIILKWHDFPNVLAKTTSKESYFIIKRRSAT